MTHREPRSVRSRNITVIVAAVLAVAVVAVVLVMTLTGPAKPKVEEHTIRGIDYTTNLELEELQGDIYLYVLVNTDVNEIVFEVEDRDDNETVQQFFAGLDTFVPGEHAVELTDVTLRIIVDGIAEE